MLTSVDKDKTKYVIRFDNNYLLRSVIKIWEIKVFCLIMRKFNLTISYKKIRVSFLTEVKVIQKFIEISLLQTELGSHIIRGV
ncbi:hypothetical protein FOLKNPGA_03438 [Legionella sp. PC1000]|nr:hypothetical protein FOLKNPGA_03438 [Legionella sp. PC1000]